MFTFDDGAGYFQKGKGSDWFSSLFGHGELWREVARNSDNVEVNYLYGNGPATLTNRIFADQQQCNFGNGVWKPDRKGRWKNGSTAFGTNSTLSASAGGPIKEQLEGVWRIQNGTGKPVALTLLANGKINNPNGNNTWKLENQILTLRWPNTAAPFGVWIDTCRVSKDGQSFDGENQAGVHISGQKYGSGNAIAGSAFLFTRYEAEAARLFGAAKSFPEGTASSNLKVCNIDTPQSFAEFTVKAATTGRHRLVVRYSNAFADLPAATHRVAVNTKLIGTISYPPTARWTDWRTAWIIVDLFAGTNQIRFSKGDHFAELDCLDVSPANE